MISTKFIADEFTRGFKGNNFGDLILYLVKSQRKSIFTPKSKVVEFFNDAIAGNLQYIPKEAWPLLEKFIDDWNSRVMIPSYWYMDCLQTFLEITKNAKYFLTNNNIPFDDEIPFRFFKSVILTHAHDVALQKKFERYIKNAIKFETSLLK